jgi:glutamyl endopeptidase
MNVRRMLRASLMLTASAALALVSATTDAQAEPQAKPDMITMVNGAGKTISVPKALVAQGISSSAGSSGQAPSENVAASKERGKSTDSVIPAGGRVQESDPYAYPWRAIVHLSTNKGDCTGFMLSRDVVVTAGHCVYRGGWVTSYRATPGKNGDYEPWGSCSGGIHDVWTNWDWLSTGSPDHDYGLVKLTCDVGNTVGWFGWWYHTGENLVNQYFFVEGYPGDKPYGTLWWAGGTIAAQTATRLSYWIETADGQSGAPVYHWDSVTPGLCGGWCVTGIATNGAAFPGATNSGIRFNPDVMSFINYWINQP